MIADLFPLVRRDGLDLQGLSDPRARTLHKFYLNFTQKVLTLAKIYGKIRHTKERERGDKNMRYYQSLTMGNIVETKKEVIKQVFESLFHFKTIDLKWKKLNS